VRKADITPIGPYVLTIVEQHLQSEGLAVDAFGPLDDVVLVRAASRSIFARGLRTGRGRLQRPISGAAVVGARARSCGAYIRRTAAP
jgi:hypothetical protein